MLQLKHISHTAIPAALERAERYRLLNEPMEAESICRDVLDVDPGNRTALVTMTLALTDQFETRGVAALDAALALLPRLPDDYGRAYYDGVVHERFAKLRLRHRDSGAAIHRAIRRALDCFDRAEKLRPAGNDEAILRWNTCVRLLQENPWIAAAGEAEGAREQGAHGRDEVADTMLE